jgi:hypothetical protein
LKRKEKLNQEPKYWFNSRNILLLQKTGDTFFSQNRNGGELRNNNRSKQISKKKEKRMGEQIREFVLVYYKFLFLHDTKKYFCFVVW